MDHTRIAALLDPFLGGDQITHTDLDHISTYIDILLRWNARINLTAVRDPDEIVTRHFGESFFAARRLFSHRMSLNGPVSSEASTKTTFRDLRGRAAFQGRVSGEEDRGALARVPTVADLGSGAGFPGVPLKIWAPGIRLTLIESNHKKATFLREVARALALTDIDIQTRRAEGLAGSTFELVTLRAVERFATVLPVAARLVAPTGRLALLIGSSQLSQAQTILPNLIWSNPESIPQSTSRILAVGRSKRRQT